MKKAVKAGLAGCMMSMMMVSSILAASKSLNNGGATWSGGENSDNIVYSKVIDLKKDNLCYKVCVWVKNDKGKRKEKTGTTSAVGSKGQVKVTMGASHSNPFIAEKAGYKNLEVVPANKN